MISLTLHVGGGRVRNAEQWQQRPKCGMAGAKPIVPFREAVAVGVKRGFPRIKQCRGRHIFGGATSELCCRPKKGE